MQIFLECVIVFLVIIVPIFGVSYFGVSLLSYPFRYNRMYKVKRKWYRSDSVHVYTPMCTYGLWKYLNVWFDLKDYDFYHRMDAEREIERDFNYCWDKKHECKTKEKTVSFKYDTRPTILCIVGGSGSGKSTIAKILSKGWGAKLITSYTTRRQRKSEMMDELEGKLLDHVFISNEEFRRFKKKDILVHTVYASNDYCCLKKDIGLKNVYVIDSKSLNYLKDHFSDKYNIKTLLVQVDKDLRLERGVLKSRIARDTYHPITQKVWDFVIVNNGSLEDLVEQVRPIGIKCFTDLVRRYGE